MGALHPTGLQDVLLPGNVVCQQATTAEILDSGTTLEHLDIHGSVMTLDLVTVIEL